MPAQWQLQMLLCVVNSVDSRRPAPFPTNSGSDVATQPSRNLSRLNLSLVQRYRERVDELGGMLRIS